MKRNLRSMMSSEGLTNKTAYLVHAFIYIIEKPYKIYSVVLEDTFNWERD